jgi:prostaglandin-H2 D-isomerase / glutathione transferase
MKEPKEYEINLKIHLAETIPFYLTKLEALAEKNQNRLALNRLTWADLHFAAITEYLNYLTKRDVLTDYPHLKGIVESVVNIEAIKKWISKRPKTDY